MPFSRIGRIFALIRCGRGLELKAFSIVRIREGINYLETRVIRWFARYRWLSFFPNFNGLHNFRHQANRRGPRYSEARSFVPQGPPWGLWGTHGPFPNLAFAATIPTVVYARPYLIGEAVRYRQSRPIRPLRPTIGLRVVLRDWCLSVLMSSILGVSG